MLKLRSFAIVTVAVTLTFSLISAPLVIAGSGCVEDETWNCIHGGSTPIDPPYGPSQWACFITTEGYSTKCMGNPEGGSSNCVETQKTCHWQYYLSCSLINDPDGPYTPDGRLMDTTTESGSCH